MKIYLIFSLILIIGLGISFLLLHLGLTRKHYSALSQAALVELAHFLIAFTFGMSGSFFTDELNVPSYISRFFFETLAWILALIPIAYHYQESLAEVFFVKKAPVRLIFPTLFVAFGLLILPYYFQRTFKIPALLPNYIDSEHKLYSRMVFSILVSPVAVELFHRGFILRTLLKRYNPMHSVLINSIFYVLCHEPIQFFSAFSSSIFFGWTVIKTRSIWIAIFTHSILNLSFYLINYFYEIDTTFATKSIAAEIGGVLVCGASIFFGVKLFSRWSEGKS